MANEAPKDLGPTERLQLSWERGKIVGHLETLFARITKDAESAMHGYLRAKRPKQRWAMLLRVGSIAGRNRCWNNSDPGTNSHRKRQAPDSAGLGVGGAWHCGGFCAPGSLLWFFQRLDAVYRN